MSTFNEEEEIRKMLNQGTEEAAKWHFRDYLSVTLDCAIIAISAISLYKNIKD